MYILYYGRGGKITYKLLVQTARASRIICMRVIYYDDRADEFVSDGDDCI